MSNNYQKKAEPIRVKVKVTRVNYIKPETEDYGIFSAVPMEYDAKLKVNSFNSLNIKGEIPYPVRVDKTYVIYLEGSPEYNEKYRNYTYTINRFETEQLTLPEEQFEFLATVTTPDIYKQLEEQYPNTPIIDLIFDDKIDLSKVKGLKEKSYEKLKANLELYRDLGKLQNLLRPLGVSIASVKKISNHFGSPDSAYYKLQENLYNMCEVKGFGFAKVDEIALKGGVDPRDEKRIKYCLGYLLEQGGQEGHSYNYYDNIVVEALDYLKIEPLYVTDYLDKCDYEMGEKYSFDDIIKVGNMVSTFGMYWDERNTLNHLDRIMDTYTPYEFTNMDEAIIEAEKEAGFKFTDEQLFAIKESLKTGVYIIEGKAGAGKTSIVKGIINILDAVGVPTIAVALSGKASQILASKGLNASTIHRALGFDGSGFAFNEYNPMMFKGIEFDEASMANANIWSSLVQAIPDGAKLIITGDSGQLSAIGAGDIMRDILASTRYPKIELQQVHRQAQDSGVIEVAHKVREGVNITGYNRELNETYGANKDLQIITMSKPKKDEVVIHPFMNEEQQKEASNPIYVVAKEIIESQISKIKYSLDREQGILDFQIICPTKSSGALSVDSLNKYAQMVYNDNKEGISKGKTIFKKDDKIIVSGNKYKINGYASIEDYKNNRPIEKEKYADDSYGEIMDVYNSYHMESPDDEIEDPYEKFDLFNGTVGIIKEIFKERKNILVKFENMSCLIPIHEDDFDSIDLGYAYSIHKSQGSSLKNLLITFDFGAFKLLSKQLVYTALTRTSGQCILLAENNALFKSIQVDASGNRRTFMSLFLQHLDSQQES